MNQPKVFGYERFNLDIVSPELPCGVSWLANCLLELDIPVWKAWNLNIAHHWHLTESGQFCYKHPASDLQQTLPALKTGRCFSFNNSIVPRFSHNPVYLAKAQHPLIFIIRDPRDALYSQWRRQFPEQLMTPTQFTHFLNRQYHHYPLSNLGFTCFYLSLCRELLKKKRHLIIRFEDFKQQPVKNLMAILNYLDIQVEQQAIQRATDASDFKHFKAIGLSHCQKGISQRQLNRAGKVYEYREHFTSEMHQHVDDVLNNVLRWLNYTNYATQRSEQTPSVPDQRFIQSVIEAVQQQYGNQLPEAFISATQVAASQVTRFAAEQVND